MRSIRGILAASVALLSIGAAATCAHERIKFIECPTSLEIQIDTKPFATYVWKDPKILRPYFANIHAANGVQVTRSHPPLEGQDATDHAEMHPGLWLAFGDLNGKDFWRNKGTVEHVEFESKPRLRDGMLLFGVRNRYRADGKTVCEEVCHIGVVADGPLYGIGWQSTFNGSAEFYFGDQEEMGLGIRVATPRTVKNGGRIVNSDGLENEKQVWGKQATWCDYSGTVDNSTAGICIVPDEENFRRSWFHARDYGVLVANPFGRNAFTKGEKSKVTVRPGEKFRIRFLVAIHSGALNVDRVIDLARARYEARGD